MANFLEFRCQISDCRLNISHPRPQQTSLCHQLTTISHPRLHQTLHGLALTIGWPALHEKAFSNSGMFTITPLIRSRDCECVFVIAQSRSCSGRSLEQSHCAKPTST